MPKTSSLHLIKRHRFRNSIRQEVTSDGEIQNRSENNDESPSPQSSDEEEEARPPQRSSIHLHHHQPLSMRMPLLTPKTVFFFLFPCLFKNIDFHLIVSFMLKKESKVVNVISICIDFNLIYSWKMN